jgi:hypothetical protein
MPVTCGGPHLAFGARSAGTDPDNFTISESTGEIQRMIIGQAVTGLNVGLPCTYRVSVGATARPHPREVT